MIENLELEQENILIERIRDMENRATYDRILEKGDSNECTIR